MIYQINKIRCLICENPLDVESIYSGLCIICDFRLRSKDIQEFEFTLEVYYEDN